VTKRTLLIVGASSALGKALSARARKSGLWNIVETYSANPIRGALKLDLSLDIPRESLDFVDDKTTALILSAVADPATVFADPLRAAQINVTGVSLLIEFLIGKRARIVFASSVEALDGVSAPQDERTDANPLNRYGEMKAQVENYLRGQAEAGSFSIVRTPWICHLNLASRCVVKTTYRAMLSAESPAFASDYLSGIVFAGDVAEGYMHLVADEELPPVIHFAADSHFSRFDLANFIKSESIRGAEMNFAETTFGQLNLAEPRARDTRLSNSLSKSRYGISYRPALQITGQKTRLLDATARHLR
jgi:dTDP-4-dehydrorhamnose reductase